MPLRRSAAAPGAAALLTASASAAVSGAAVALRAMATVPRCTATTRTSGACRRQRQGPGPHEVNDQLQGEHADLLAEPQPRPRSRWHGMREVLRSAHPLAWPTRRRGGARAGPGGRGRRHLSQRAARQGCTCHFEAAAASRPITISSCSSITGSITAPTAGGTTLRCCPIYSLAAEREVMARCRRQRRAAMGCWCSGCHRTRTCPSIPATARWSGVLRPPRRGRRRRPRASRHGARHRRACRHIRLDVRDRLWRRRPRRTGCSRAAR